MKPTVKETVNTLFKQLQGTDQDKAKALEAIESVSLLGEHAGVMDDDLFDLLAELKGDKDE